MRTIATRLYLSAILGAGAAIAASMLWRLSIADPLKFACYCSIAVGSAFLKINLPGMLGSLSFIQVFVLIGLADLSLPECVIAVSLAIATQSVVHTVNRPRAIHLLFNVASVALATIGCSSVFSSGYLHNHGGGLLLRLTLSVTVYFLMNTLAVAAVISLTESKPLMQVWARCRWTYPCFLAAAAFAWIFHHLAARFGWQPALLSMPATYLIYAGCHLYLGRLQSEKAHAEDIAALHLRTIEALVMAIGAKDRTTHDHLQRVKVYASEIGKELKLSALEMEAIGAAAMLHDIGKLAVPEYIVSKPGKLTPEEFEKMKIHPVAGAQIIEQARFPYPLAPIVRGHHEKWDGTGYPDGLAGEAIPIGARVLAAVDCLDALASDRQYRKAVPLDQAMRMVAEGAGTSFDPRIVEILQRRYRELEAMAQMAPVVERPSLDFSPIERGDAPGAGFEETLAAGSDADNTGFLTSIADAREEMQTLFELSADLGRSATLSVFASKLRNFVGYDLICIYSVQNDALYPEFVDGAERELFSSMRIPLGEGLSGWVAQNDSSVVNGTPSVEPSYLNDPAAITNLKSALAVPLEFAGGVIGVLSLYSGERNAFSRDDLRVLEAMSPRLGAALRKDRRRSGPRDGSVTDNVTGLPNSRSLYLHLDAELARCREFGGGPGVLLCDLDGFRRVNDGHGHQEGNRILQAVADTLKKCCRDCDYVARIGGDEFAIVLRNPEGGSMPEHFDRFRSAVEECCAMLGYSGLSLSIGGLIPDFPFAGADAILAEADRKMYTDKSRRRPEDLLSLARSIDGTNEVVPADATAN